MSFRTRCDQESGVCGRCFCINDLRSLGRAGGLTKRNRDFGAKERDRGPKRGVRGWGESKRSAVPRRAGARKPLWILAENATARRGVGGNQCVFRRVVTCRDEVRRIQQLSPSSPAASTRQPSPAARRCHGERRLEVGLLETKPSLRTLGRR